MQKRILGINATSLVFFCLLRLLMDMAADQRKALERHEGDREEDETKAEKAEERELVRKRRITTR